jgi:hypothetical protein
MLSASKTWAWLLVAAVVVASQLGCVRRRMTIRSNPPGALVYVDNYEIGVTPCSTDFIYYGTREIKLVKDGYETLKVTERIWPPWYEYPVLEFISENMVPAEIRDERLLAYNMQPQYIVPTDQLMGRAEGLRRGVQQASAQAGAGPAVNLPPLLPSPETLPPGGRVVPEQLPLPGNPLVPQLQPGFQPGPQPAPLLAPPAAGQPLFLPPPPGN